MGPDSSKSANKFGKDDGGTENRADFSMLARISGRPLVPSVISELSLSFSFPGRLLLDLSNKTVLQEHHGKFEEPTPPPKNM